MLSWLFGTVTDKLQQCVALFASAAALHVILGFALKSSSWAIAKLALYILMPSFACLSRVISPLVITAAR